MAFCFVPCGFVAHVFVPRASFYNNDVEMPWTIMQWQLFITLMFEALDIEDILQQSTFAKRLNKSRVNTNNGSTLGYHVFHKQGLP